MRKSRRIDEMVIEMLVNACGLTTLEDVRDIIAEGNSIKVVKRG